MASSDWNNDHDRMRVSWAAARDEFGLTRFSHTSPAVPTVVFTWVGPLHHLQTLCL